MAITTDPTYPVAEELVTLGLSAASGTVTRFEITSLPPDSNLSTGMLRDASGAYIATFTPDVPGVYGVKGYDLKDITGIARYAGDPAGTSRTVILSTQTADINVGTELDLPIRTLQGHDVTLRIIVNDDTVRSAELVDAKSTVADAAANASAVTAALAGLVGEDADDLSSDLHDLANDIREEYSDHIANEPLFSYHDNEDDVNVVTLYEANNDESAIVLLNRLSTLLDAHMVATTTVEDPWHAEDDTNTAPLVGKASTVEQAIVLEADIRRRYESHRVQAGSIHNPADSFNALAAAGPLNALLVAYLAAVAAPTAKAGDNVGTVKVASRFGFRKRS